MKSQVPQELQAPFELYAQARKPELEVNLPWPPSVNRYWGHRPFLPKMALIKERYDLKGWDGFWKWLQKNTTTRDYMRPDGEVFKEHAAWIFKSTRVRFGTANCATWLNYHPPRRGRVDCMNFDKGIFDAAEWAGVVDNDSQLQVACLVTKGEVVKGGLVEVKIWRLE